MPGMPTAAATPARPPHTSARACTRSPRPSPRSPANRIHPHEPPLPMSRERGLCEMTAASGADRQARHALETRVRAVTADITDLERTRRWINIAVWGIALGVMIYGAINVTALLI